MSEQIKNNIFHEDLDSVNQTKKTEYIEKNTPSCADDHSNTNQTSKAQTIEKNTPSCADDLDAIIEAGKILMESGAEVYRIEETMKHMASSLQVDPFNAYVVNRGIILSGTNRNGNNESRVASVCETSIHLEKIEAVNALSRELEEKKCFSSKEILVKLKNINAIPDPNLWFLLMAYFIGAGCFSYAIGSCAKDSLSSAVIGLIMGLVLQLAGKVIKTPVLLTIIGSSVVTILANLVYLTGFGQHRGFIILGSLMLLVPGAAFTNSVREFSQNNHSTGMSLLMSALLICLSISVGVALTTDFLPFAEQMTSVFSNDVDSALDVITRTAMAGVGTIAFSLLFHAPKKYFPDLGFLGATSWLIYLLMDMYFPIETLTIFVPALFAALSSRFLSVKRKCPVTIFLSTSIFPLIPGLSFYRSVYFLITGNQSLGWHYMRSCFISAFAIALSIIIVQEIRVRSKRPNTYSSSDS